MLSVAGGSAVQVGGGWSCFLHLSPTFYPSAVSPTVVMENLPCVHMTGHIAGHCGAEV